MKKNKIMIALLSLLLFFSSVTIQAEDNADSGTDGSQKAVAGFYRSREWMYKVSIYVGKSSKSNVNGSMNDFYLIGNPIFLAPSSLHIIGGYDVYYSPYNKMQYLSGMNLNISLMNDSKYHEYSNLPSIPIINGGNITAVKSYFGDATTLKNLLDNIAKDQGTTKEALLTSYTYTVNGETKNLTTEELLPEIDANGRTKNKVPYLIVYEPIAIGYLTDKKTALALTATEYAMVQKLGKNGINFFNRSLGGDNPQLMWGLTHRDLPNSIFLEESWVGLPARNLIKNRKATREWTKTLIEQVGQKIIAGSGIGMRFLKANATDIGTPITIEKEGGIKIYRANTEVITSVRVHTKATGNRVDFLNPDNKGKVTFTINGMSKTHEVIMPDGASQLAWVKWKTPESPGKVMIQIQASPGLFLDSNVESKTIEAMIVDMNENIPPDPEATDLPKDFNYKEVPNPIENEVTENSWGEYFATWHENWVDHGDWVDDTSKSKNVDGSYPQIWKADLKDEGWWDWELRTYSAKLSGEVKVIPSDENPTGQKIKGKENYEIKSGYGIQTEVSTTIVTDAPSSDHYTTAGNAIAYFPEFQYKKYWRLLDRKKVGHFSFKKNEYSQWEAPVHFTPLWYPDKDYILYVQVIDAWTPAGMLKINRHNYIKIKGNVYDDWHIGPTKYQP